MLTETLVYRYKVDAGSTGKTRKRETMMNDNMQRAVDALKTRALRARDLAVTLDRRAEELVNAKTDGRVKGSEVFVWAINEIENFTRNLDFNDLARCCAMLAQDECGRPFQLIDV